jgi:hypothetical protein
MTLYNSQAVERDEPRREVQDLDGDWDGCLLGCYDGVGGDGKGICFYGMIVVLLVWVSCHS